MSRVASSEPPGYQLDDHGGRAGLAASRMRSSDSQP